MNARDLMLEFGQWLADDTTRVTDLTEAFEDDDPELYTSVVERFLTSFGEPVVEQALPIERSSLIKITDLLRHKTAILGGELLIWERASCADEYAIGRARAALDLIEREAIRPLESVWKEPDSVS